MHREYELRMDYFAVMLINIFGAAIITLLEKPKSDMGSKNIVMGVWPYNIVLLLGMLVLVISDILDRNHKDFIAILGVTALFYILNIFRHLRIR